MLNKNKYLGGVFLLFSVIFSLSLISCQDLLNLLNQNGTQNTSSTGTTTGDTGGANTGDSGDTGGQDPLPLSTEKTLSDYVDGVRELNFGERDKNYNAIFVSTIQPRPRPDYTEIDNKVKNLVIPTTESIENAGKAIIAALGDGYTVKEKARAIFTWVSLNIDYDSEYSGEAYTKEGAFTNRKAVCNGYSELYKALCEAVDIVCEIRAGNVSSGGSGRYKLLPLAHAWNIVYENENHENGFLIDTTWASVGTFESGKNIDDQWFDPDPCYFVTSHWSEKESSLTGREISRDEFFTLPVLYPSWEKYGIDGKELLEFCWTHTISSVVDFENLTKGTNVLYMPVGMVDIGKSYSFAFEHNGSSVSGSFKPLPSASQSGHFFADFNSAGTMTYVLSNSEEEETVDYSKPVWVVYDDNIEFPVIDYSTLGIKLDNGWYASYDFNTTKPEQIIFYDNQEGRYNPETQVAVYDAFYQQWSTVKGRMIMGTYDAGLTAEEKEEQDAVLVHALKQVISKIDSSIPLDRMGDCTKVDFNVVYVPLSKEEEVKNSVLEYDWYRDDEFREFVYWMERHNVPASQIDFYKAMARYPSNRGCAVDVKKWQEARKIVGLDYSQSPWTPPLLDENNEEYNAGGMQLFFEYRKQEERHLFNNEKISILLLSIRNSDLTTHTEFAEDYFTTVGEIIKEALCAGGLDRNYEIDFAEISLSYTDYQKTYYPEWNEGTGDGDWVGYGDWKLRTIGNEKIFEELAKVNPSLAEKYSDETKTAVLKLFSDEGRPNTTYKSLTCKSGFQFIMGDEEAPFWTILNALGYHRIDHNHIFGTLCKYDSPACFAMNCVRDPVICPLCLYSFDID